jgi:hypothetical protein
LQLIYAALPRTIRIVAVLGACLFCAPEWGQISPVKSRLSYEPEGTPRRHRERRSASIHWQQVPLRDAIARLKPLFDETVFVDRRVDPSLRVTLDIDAASAEAVVTAIATAHELGVGRLGRLVYVGPRPTAEQLRAVAEQRGRDVATLPAGLRTSLAGRRILAWPRLAEPRQLVTSIAEQYGWRVVAAERIPHDLWAAGELPELNAAEQLTVFLAGFDLTFELKPDERTISIVPLAVSDEMVATQSKRQAESAKTPAPRRPRGKRQVYTLRVQEKPVGAVLRELSQRLKWAIQIDDDAIRAAGRSLEHRVSFAVENADQEQLLEALLKPAGLEYRVDGNQVWVTSSRYADK